MSELTACNKCKHCIKPEQEKSFYARCGAVVDYGDYDEMNGAYRGMVCSRVNKGNCPHFESIDVVPG